MIPVQLHVQLVLSDQRETLCALFLGEHLWDELRGEAEAAEASRRDVELLLERAFRRECGEAQ